MYLIVGLGNPDKKYLNTFHNVGFMCVDRLAYKLCASYDKTECQAVTAHAKIAGTKVIIAKPTTYMNLSGNAVVQLVNKYKIDLDKLIIVYDDIDIPLGDVRIRANGSAGTHNGMRSVVAQMGTTQIQRVRVGIYRQTPMALVDYVLSQLTTDDKIIMDSVCNSVASALNTFGSGEQFDKVMREGNIRTTKVHAE